MRCRALVPWVFFGAPLALVFPHAAWADETQPSVIAHTAPHPEPPKERWYGWQILPIDAGAFTLYLASVASQSSGACDGFCSTSSLSTLLLVGAVGAYLLGGPIVHWAHHHVARGFESLGLRLVLPGAGVAMMAAGANSSNAGDVSTLTGVGALVTLAGGLVAPLTDSAVFAVDPPRPAPAVLPSAAQLAPQANVVPLLHIAF